MIIMNDQQVMLPCWSFFYQAFTVHMLDFTIMVIF